MLIYPTRGKYTAEVGYRGYGPTYRTINVILYGECATGKPFLREMAEKFQIYTIFHSEVVMTYITNHVAIRNFLWLCNHHMI